MIIDKISNAANYTSVVKNLDKAIELINADYMLPLGRHEFNGGAVISCDITSAHISERMFEAHQAFADVMFILEGEETVSFCNISELALFEAGEPDADCSFYCGDGKDIAVTLPAGYFYAVLPGEGHKPCVHTEKAKKTKKYVIKCRQS